MRTPLRIDSHQHFWRYNEAEYGWITPALGEIRRDFTPADLAGPLAAAGLHGSIAVQARSSVAETHALLDLARETEGSPAPILGVVGWLDLLAPDVERDLEGLVSDGTSAGGSVAHASGGGGRGQLVGVRHIVQDEPDDRFLDRPDFRRGVRAAVERGLVYDLLIYPRQLPAALDFVRALDGAPIVLDHCAKPPLRAGHGTPEMADWARGVRALGRAPHVACKVSGLVTEADWARWRDEDLLRCIDIVRDAFGPRRVMFGSDWPVALLAAPYERVYGLVERALAGASEDERAQFFGGNAARIYGLG
ncbi:MAG: amidohydrolase family protein [Planctomycetota bacterium]